jgi:hypothetical protein
MKISINCKEPSLQVKELVGLELNKDEEVFNDEEVFQVDDEEGRRFSVAKEELVVKPELNGFPLDPNRPEEVKREF